MFEPDKIRQDLELLWTRIFAPAAWVADTTYQNKSFVSNGGNVYMACGEVAGAAEFNPDDWQQIGPVLPVLYQNVTSEIPEQGAVRIITSWTGTGTTPAIPCSDYGNPGFVEGVLSVFLYVPKNEGTSRGLQIATTIRRFMQVWDKLPAPTANPRPCYLMTGPVGPNSAGSEVETSFFTYSLSTELQAWDEPTPICA